MLNSSKLFMISSALDAAAMRQKVIADNIANVDTPNYKSKGVAFEEELRKAMKAKPAFEGFRTDPRHIPFGGAAKSTITPKIFVKPGIMQNHLNNVDVDAEMTDMVKNQVWYNALIDQTNSHFSGLKKAISGGK
ncbi:flagellar basal body rod protein FlgB [Ammoniphilus sp. 3BR4]|uniref:flagellar basal body rod protein FlgB n=1 Tax=Ammoniphilus sp. 3BR4 TaxID=3158265 RepID=UPI003467E599